MKEDNESFEKWYSESGEKEIKSFTDLRLSPREMISFKSMLRMAWLMSAKYKKWEIESKYKITKKKR